MVVGLVAISEEQFPKLEGGGVGALNLILTLSWLKKFKKSKRTCEILRRERRSPRGVKLGDHRGEVFVLQGPKKHHRMIDSSLLIRVVRKSIITTRRR